MTLQKHYNHYRDRDSDLDLDWDWGVVIYNQIVTWTAFAILAMFHWFNPILDYLHTLDANQPQKLWSRIFLTNLMYGWFVLFTEHELWLMALGSFQWSFFLGLHSDFTVEQRHRFDSLCCSWQSPPGVPNNSDLNWYDMDLHLFFWLMSVSPCISLFLESSSVLREAPVSKKCSFFEHCSNGGGGSTHVQKLCRKLSCVLEVI